MQILLANPRGFCAGVRRAITIVEQAVEIYGAPIYVYHEIVHNYYIINNLKKIGVIFVKSLDEVPENSVLIFSAHGVSQKIKKEAKNSNIKILLDATCPLVKKIHMEVKKASRNGIEAVLIGHVNHPEVQGTIGQYENKSGGIYTISSIEDISKLILKNEKKINFMTQSTLSVDDTTKIIDKLRQRFPYITGPRKEDICYATSNRQKAVKCMAQYAELILVVGSQNSSNANRLVEVAKSIGKRAKLIDSAKDIKKKWLLNIKYIGITASASTPDVLVQEVIEYLNKTSSNSIIELIGKQEKIRFHL
ncbi:4-hydroxy-3-methylbut-2-enyl diphosphate reductase [Candidatus Pantoea edessiphila]|uniref:4-hydroxy-3-methylbut-2-enyl diphosphate reductase n=1 Tax=Candidatus Pantoea edessiphila TaxID=2044610 RepID=A0A2P5SY50_9GAMM|nr:4-hydroxy-3-methylbut-2-enyl diphosphate reductase [Candidatus Pantoea edessiphila]MBK4775610.1 4-hydroxy-3-methylbut-2-enyl diphosphate reductase [Pantoea sp. Edef]PPI87258.1 4-hydroxy-3-methylbut-2-enyl diphosphate reductase [Candidatus Pantoea edessiphila]